MFRRVTQTNPETKKQTEVNELRTLLPIVNCKNYGTKDCSNTTDTG